jgi:hypothetical protein
VTQNPATAKVSDTDCPLLLHASCHLGGEPLPSWVTLDTIALLVGPVLYLAMGGRPSGSAPTSRHVERLQRAIAVLLEE